MSRQTLQKLIKRQFRGTQNVKRQNKSIVVKMQYSTRKAWDWDMPTV
jgi:hypothetical protein